MNTKLFAAFLLTALSTGCVVVDNDGGGGSKNPPPSRSAWPGDVTFHWSFAGFTCQQTPDVHSVRVIIEGERLENGGIYPCLVSGYPGVVLHDFRPGRYPFALQGLGGSNEVLFERAGHFTIDGDVEVTVSLDSVASYAFLTWRMPPSGDFANPSCAQAGVDYVDVWIDGQDEGRYFCTQGTSGNGVPTRYLGIGQHTITLLAVDSYGYPLYRFDGPLYIQPRQATSAHYDLQWAVGGAVLRWQLRNGPVAETCMQAGVTKVYVNFEDEQGQWVYPGAGDEQPCNVPWVAYDYLMPGTYRVSVQAVGSWHDYASPWPNAPMVTVQAGVWPPEQAPLTLMLYRE